MSSVEMVFDGAPGEPQSAVVAVGRGVGAAVGVTVVYGRGGGSGS